MKRSPSSDLSLMIKGALPKHLRTIDMMLGVTGPATKEVKVREEDQLLEVVDEMEPKASPEHGPKMVEEMRKVQEVI